MRPLATWLVVGALALIGLFAARDALRNDEAPASAPTVVPEDGRPQSPPGFAGPPRIVGREGLAGDLRALGAEGVLYLTYANCRRLLLRLPELRWTTPGGLPGPQCPPGTQPVVDQRFGFEASQVDQEVIEVRSEEWSLRFQGTAPAFTPEGRLTFIRAGRLWEWTVECPPAAERVIFRGFRSLSRCPRPVQGTPDQLREVVWLNADDFAAVAGSELKPRLLLVRRRRVKRLFLSVGSRMRALQASPGGRWLAARVDEEVVLFDTRRAGALQIPGFGPEASAVTWSPDDRFGAVATQSFVRVFPSSRPQSGIAIPVSAVAVEWR
jgi:hypothetical protein